MPPVLSAEQAKDWAWSWARLLDRDITRSPDWFADAAALSGSLPPQQSAYLTALSWMTAAYFEFLRGRWTRERAYRQVWDAEQILIDLEEPR